MEQVYIDSVWSEDSIDKRFKTMYVICDAETGMVRYYPWNSRKRTATEEAKNLGHEIIDKPEGVKTHYGYP